MTNTVFLSGEKCYLRPLELADSDLFYHWFLDREVTRYSLTHLVFPQSKIQTREWLEANLKNKSNFGLGIVSKNTNQLIGEAGVSKLDWVNRSGEYYIFIGDKNYWNRGIATEVTRLVTNYGFSELNLNRIMLTVSSENEAGEKAYKKAGFRQEGVMREACFRQGRFHDKILMSILRSEWVQARSI